MRVQLAWLTELVPQLDGKSPQEIGDLLSGAGIEVDEIGGLGPDDVAGLYVGEVAQIEELTEFKKPIRYCQVRFDDGSDPEQTRGIVCGATNFAVGDKIVAALPGAVLPGDFHISARKTYGRVSDGMICSEREMGLGEDHDGILVLPDDAPIGADAVEYLGLHDVVLVTEPTPDRGYQLALRGIARDLAAVLGVPFTDPADQVPAAPEGDGFPVELADPACDVFTTRIIRGFDPAAPTPAWMARRLTASGMRPISLAVDVTNYVMLLLGQPLHAYDLDKLQGRIIVRKALEGERITTLDDVERTLSADDLLITDEAGIQGIAGVMGAEHAEISDSTTSIMLEAAHFDPTSISRTARKHGLLSEAGRRFERTVDPTLAPRASALATALLVEHGGGPAEPTMLRVGEPALPRPITVEPQRVRDLVGVDYSVDRITEVLQRLGCQVDPDGDQLIVTPPPWRPDFVEPSRVAEEVARIDGYDKIPSVLPKAMAGRGLNAVQRARRSAGRALAAAGYVETPSMSFQDDADLDRLGVAADDRRRQSVRLANPIAADQATLRTTLLPGLLASVRRNVSRGAEHVATFETGVVFFEPARPRSAAPIIDRGIQPTSEQLAALEAARPVERLHAAVATAGTRPASWFAASARATWREPIEAIRRLADAVGTAITITRAEMAPWHPGRCASIALSTGEVIGYAGELHPQVCEELDLPRRTSVAEIDLEALIDARDAEATAPQVSPFPRATQDLAFVLDADLPVADVEATIRDAGGDLLEDVHMFDVYSGAQVGDGKRSLAFALTMRADDRTLGGEEITGVREAVISAVRERHGGVLR
ncbi:phenylalanine--tRNA ligase subunit beta [Blastococcus sp. Marseille-P5729]|uniref:phenylalanine--tRNA ligase subunit beta n=1 Tax=Blastococcus sp. Marseille-P5729 TaxID=2086582 RepID=UPI000D0ED9E0|nr:phenylalanine--tRNA ligase subunit beta [Blastococcus sp. Marseille-P5729]